MTTAPDLEPIRQRRPALANAAERYIDFAGTKLDPKLVLICRLRIGQITAKSDAPVAPTAATRAAGITEGQLRELGQWQDSAAFDATEKACLEFAEYFCYSAQAVTDEHVAKVRQYLSPEQVLALTASFWVSDASSRLANFLGSVKAPQ
jgi:alkylhydroperoxidase family enzyme